jgi:uncharacterized membrane protein|tara:strand:- start:5 stop:349 length:345 start_codon:yes stop_codon:yes gene_type:complete
MEWIKEIFIIIAEIIDIIGIIILIFGFAKLLMKYLGKEFLKHPLITPITEIQKIRCELGIYILLALDFLIASDIIHTIMKITKEQLIALSVMIILRIAIGYFLGKEIEEIHNKE